MNGNVRLIKRALTQGTLTLTTLALFGVPDLVRADVVAVDDPACATTGTFATLEAAGSCTIGDKTYSNFSFQSSNVAAGDLGYSIVNNGNIANGFSFQIANFFATGTGAADMTVGFNVIAPAATISSVQLTQVGTAFRGGIASIGELVCLGGAIIGCPSQDTRTVSTISGGALSDNIDFGSVGEIGVLKDISAVGNGGFASISNFIETVDQTAVPEPTFYIALLVGVVVTLVYGRRQKRTA